MNIVHVPRRFVTHSWGGTETVILQSCRQLQAQGHQVRVVTTNALAHSDHECVEGVPVERFGYFYPILRLDPRAREQFDQVGGNMFSFSLMRRLRTIPDLDVIHLHTGNRIGGIARCVAARRRIPYLVSLHGGVLDVPVEERGRLAERKGNAIEWGKVLSLWVGSRRVLDDAAAIICVNAFEATRTQAKFPRKAVHYLPNGVDSTRFATGDGAAFRRQHGLPADAPVVLVVGRIDPQKNQLLAIHALAGLHRHQVPACLVIIGHVTDPEYHQRLEREASRLGLSSSIRILPGLPGGSDALINAYHAADVFLLPSLHEPFGIVVLEAWAAGKPVVAARVGGVPAFVRHRENGLLFGVGDAEEAAAGLREVLANPDLSRLLAQTGRGEAVTQYDWEIIGKRLERIYHDVIHARTAGQR